MLDRQLPAPLWQQFYTALRDGVLNGSLKPGTRLPPTRALARELGVGRNTVNNAYDQLIAEGYLEGRQGAGTFVSARLPEEVLQVRIRRGQRSEPQEPEPLQVHTDLSRYGRALQGAQLDIVGG